MALHKLLLALTILAATGSGAHAQLLGGRGVGGVGPSGIGVLPPNVPVTTVHRGLAAPPVPPPPTILTGPAGTATEPLSTVAPAVTDAISNTGLAQNIGNIAATSGRDMVGRPLGQTLLGRDERGLPIVAGQVLAVSPTAESLAVAQRLNFRILRHDQLGALGLSSTVLGAPGGMDAVQALSALREADPAGTYDYANIYNPTGGPSVGAQSAGGNNASDLLTPPTATQPLRIGMIDGGVEPHHSALSTNRIIAQNFAGSGDAPASAHGTAIASLLAGMDRDFSGYAPGATVYAADVFGGEPNGGSAAEIALALNWLAANNVAVVNISLAGPPNALLGAAVRAFVGNGHVLVAAAGNDGPAAPPNYPAAYAGVIGVTAIDTAHHLALDANRSAARFAALGVNVRAAALPSGYGTASGTSYASPLVAARFALLITAPNKDNCQAALATLSREALPVDGSIVYLSAPSNLSAAR
jgi:hypothetical protein